MTRFARSFLVECARRLPKAGMVGPVPVRTRLLSFACSSLLSNSVAGKRDSDVRIQKRGILLHGRGFLLQGRKGGSSHV